MCSTASQLKDNIEYLIRQPKWKLSLFERCVMVGLSNLFRGADRLVLVFPLPYHFHYPFSTQPRAFTRSGTFTAFPLSFYFRGSVASSAPGDPAYSSQVSYWTKGWLIDSSLSE